MSPLAQSTMVAWLLAWRSLVRVSDLTVLDAATFIAVLARNDVR